jgi:hypothetical protein
VGYFYYFIKLSDITPDILSLSQFNRTYYNKWARLSNKIIFSGIMYSIINEHVYDFKNLLDEEESVISYNNINFVFEK